MNETEIPSGKAIRRADDVLSADVNGALLMMSIEQGRYFNLNIVGARIWELLEKPTTMEGLVAALAAEYDVEPGTAWQEVSRFIEALRERGLLAPSDSAAAWG